MEIRVSFGQLGFCAFDIVVENESGSYRAIRMLA